VAFWPLCDGEGEYLGHFLSPSTAMGKELGSQFWSLHIFEHQGYRILLWVLSLFDILCGILGAGL